MSQRLDDEISWLFRSVGKWHARTTEAPAEVQVGSELYADDEATNYLHLSHMVHISLLLAVDHLHCLRTLLVDANYLHIGAPFTIIRSAHENAAVSLWLLGPEDAQERRRRRLQLALADAQNNVDVQNLTNQLTSPMKERRADIVRIASRSGITEAELGTRQPGFEHIVKVAGRHVGDARLHQVVWKSCSGLAHGRQWATVALLQREEAERYEDVLSLKLNANLQNVVNTAIAAASLLQAGWELYDYRRRRWHGSPRPPSWLRP